MSKQILSEEITAKLDKFKLRARLIVEGFMVGLHKSPYHGFSVEFSDHRQYNPGDSIRNIDWKVYGKTNRHYVRRYEEETNLRSYILVDHSQSMGYSSGKVSKLEYAKTLASALSYLMINQQDALGLLTFNEKITNYFPPRATKSYLDIVLAGLETLQAEEKTMTSGVLHNLAERINKRGLIILISDLIDDPESIMAGLQHFRHKKNEVVVFHIQDKQEYLFDFQSETEFIDSETKEMVTVNPWLIKKEYLKEYELNVEFLKKRCFEARIEYNAVSTETSYDELLLQYLIKRGKLY